MKRFITHYPMTFGLVISMVLAVFIMIIVTWFPDVWVSQDRHKRLVQAVFFTVTYFGLYLYGLRKWRRSRAFWPTISGLLIVHIAAITAYSLYIQPILVWQWPIVGLAELFGAAFFLQSLSTQNSKL